LPPSLPALPPSLPCLPTLTPCPASLPDHIHKPRGYLHEEEDNHNTTDERKEYGAEDRYLSELQKAHLIGEFVIVAKFGGHALRHLKAIPTR